MLPGLRQLGRRCMIMLDNETAHKVFRPGVFGATSKSFSTMNKAELFEFVARTSDVVRTAQKRLDVRMSMCGE